MRIAIIFRELEVAMNINGYFSRLFHSPIPRLAIVTLIALACCTPAFCGEIHDAAKTGDLAKAEALLKENPNLVRSKGDAGWTPLHLAAMFDHPKELAQLLLTNKADVNAKANDGWTPLHMAASHGNKDVAELLLANMADINAKNKKGYTPLCLAAARGHKDVVELLLAHGAKARDDDKVTLLYVAAMQGDLVKVKELLKSNAGLVFSKDYDGYAPLHWAAWYGNKDVAELLLAYGAKVNAKTEDGFMPLFLAEMSHHEDIAELLRQHGGHE
jgi:ankyrin repeat protein